MLGKFGAAGGLGRFQVRAAKIVFELEKLQGSGLRNPKPQIPAASGLAGICMWVVVKIRVPFWVP